jgi:hypothetical protein
MSSINFDEYFLYNNENNFYSYYSEYKIQINYSFDQ